VRREALRDLCDCLCVLRGEWFSVMTTAKILAVDDEPDFELLLRQRFRRQIRDGEFSFRFAITAKKRWRHWLSRRTSI
jgi:hypothetical protein